MAIFEISPIGSIDPISLFANITDIKIVSGLIALSSSLVFTIPSESTFIYVISKPSSSNALHVFNIAICSIFVVIICFPLFFLDFAIPLSAKLSASEPPDVKQISLSSSAPIALATCFLASSIAFLFSIPYLYIVDGFPNFSVKYGIILSKTSFFVLVVAA